MSGFSKLNFVQHAKPIHQTINLDDLFNHLNNKPMNAAAKSVYYFGYYLIVTGLTLLATPNILLNLFSIPETSEVWIRVVGMLVLNIGLLYIYLSRENSRLFCLLTCYLRISVLAWFILFASLGWASPMLILFGAIDFLGAIWTYSLLRKS